MHDEKDPVEPGTDATAPDSVARQPEEIYADLALQGLEKDLRDARAAKFVQVVDPAAPSVPEPVLTTTDGPGAEFELDQASAYEMAPERPSLTPAQLEKAYAAAAEVAYEAERRLKDIQRRPRNIEWNVAPSSVRDEAIARVRQAHEELLVGGAPVGDGELFFFRVALSVLHNVGAL